MRVESIRLLLLLFAEDDPTANAVGLGLAPPCFGGDGDAIDDVLTAVWFDDDDDEGSLYC